MLNRVPIFNVWCPEISKAGENIISETGSQVMGVQGRKRSLGRDLQRLKSHIKSFKEVSWKGIPDSVSTRRKHTNDSKCADTCLYDFPSLTGTMHKIFCPWALD